MDVPNLSLLLTPTRKKTSFGRKYPFPIIRNESGDSVSESWNCVIGDLCEDCVLIKDKASMKMLFTMGFFGKGTLSKSAPQVVFNDLAVENTPVHATRKRKVSESSTDENETLLMDQDEEEDEIEVVDCSSNDQKKHRKKKKYCEVLVVDSGSSGSDEPSTSSGYILQDLQFSRECATSSKDSSEVEHLQLSFEEAYFLSYGLGCLVVKDKDQPLDLMRLWHKFCELYEPHNFPIMYTAYHHFRSKGWIVRSGLKYGVDFLLYKDGPPFYHSTYAVIVKPVKEQHLRDMTSGGRQPLTWSQLAAINRIVTHASKGLLFLYVIKPPTISENKISTPFCVSQFKLEEVIFNRWVPEENREEES